MSLIIKLPGRFVKKNRKIVVDQCVKLKDDTNTTIK
jgi:hypothetical protein